MVTTNHDTRTPVPQTLIDQIGFKKGNVIITGFAEIPTRHTPDHLWFFAFGLPDKGVYTSSDVAQWKHNQTLRNAGRWAETPGQVFARIPIKRMHAYSYALPA